MRTKKLGEKKEGQKTHFNFDDLFGDGSDFDDEDTAFFGGFNFVKQHLADFGFGDLDGMDFGNFGEMGGKFKFSSSSSYTTTKDGVKVRG